MMKKRFAMLAPIVLLASLAMAQVPVKKVDKRKMDTTSQRKAIPKPEKYDPKAHQWPKKDSLKSIDSRRDSSKKRTKPPTLSNKPR